MSEFTSQGVKTKTLSEWYDACVNFKKNVWGENFVTDPTTKQGADIVQLSELLYNAEMNNVSAFAQLNVNTAEGICLDYLGQIKGVLRNAGFPQQIKVKITSSITGYTIPTSLIFQTVDGGHNYIVSAAENIDSLEQEIVLISTESGNPEVVDGDSLRTTTSFPQILDVKIVNGGITEGEDTEDDASYRKRLKDAGIGYIGTLELMFSELLNLPGVSKLGYYYNDEENENDKGIPAFSSEFLVVSDDGVDEETFNKSFATKICDIKVPGTPTFGNTTVNVQNYLGQDKVIHFTRPTKVNVEVKAKIAETSTGYFSLASVDLIKQEIKDYVNSLEIGYSVNWSRILGFISSDNGFSIRDWAIRRVDGSWGKDDIIVSDREYTWVDSLDNIVISTEDI